jgi:hypothetical protein
MRPICMFVILAVLLGSPAGAVAQQRSPVAALGASASAELPVRSLPLAGIDFQRVSVARESTPRWLKWGLIGSGVGAVTFALLGRTTIDSSPNPVLQDAALGAAAGFVLLGGSIALYDAVCAPASVSRGAGLC